MKSDFCPWTWNSDSFTVIIIRRALGKKWKDRWTQLPGLTVAPPDYSCLFWASTKNGVAVITDLCIALVQACVETSLLLCNSFLSLAHTCFLFPSFDLTYLRDEHLSYFALLFFFCCQSSRCSFQIAFALHYSCWVPSTPVSIFSFPSLPM